jgi:hypothetical protein
MDQWFDESQFESYRAALGFHIATAICPADARSLADFFEQVSAYLQNQPAAGAI